MQQDTCLVDLLAAELCSSHQAGSSAALHTASAMVSSEQHQKCNALPPLLPSKLLRQAHSCATHSTSANA